LVDEAKIIAEYFVLHNITFNAVKKHYLSVMAYNAIYTVHASRQLVDPKPNHSQSMMHIHHNFQT